MSTMVLRGEVGWVDSGAWFRTTYIPVTVHTTRVDATCPDCGREVRLNLLPLEKAGLGDMVERIRKQTPGIRIFEGECYCGALGRRPLDLWAIACVVVDNDDLTVETVDPGSVDL